MAKPAIPETKTLALEFGTLKYTVKRSAKRRRSVAFYIQPDGDGVRVLAPLRTSDKSIQDMLRQRGKWIGDKLKERKPAQRFAENDMVMFQGIPHRLVIKHTDSGRSKVSQQDGIIEISMAAPEDSIREETQTEFTLWCKRQARRIFRERLDYWAKRLGVAYGRMTVSSPTRRWGSCSHRDDIRLNWRLVILPPEILDYVVAHELCHVRHKNHSRDFWNFLASVMPDCTKRRKALRAWEAGS